VIRLERDDAEENCVAVKRRYSETPGRFASLGDEAEAMAKGGEECRPRGPSPSYLRKP
jgi:hypothetical protein